MRKLLALLIAGLALGLLTKAAFACHDDISVNQPPDNPEVQQPQPGGTA